MDSETFVTLEPGQRFVLVDHIGSTKQTDRKLRRFYSPLIRIGNRVRTARRRLPTKTASENYGEALANRAFYLFNPRIKRSG